LASWQSKTNPLKSLDFRGEAKAEAEIEIQLEPEPE